MPSLIRQDDLLLRLMKDVNDIRANLRRAVGSLPLFDISNENTPDTLEGDANNYVPGNYDVLRLASTKSVAITGFRGGVKGRFLRLYNVGDYEITISHESGASDLANRVVSPTGQDIVINVDGQLVLYYDLTAQRWVSSWNSGADRISCCLRLDSPFTVADTDLSYPPIPWATVVKDTGSFFDAANPTYITIPETGWYEFNVQIEWDIEAAYSAAHFLKTILRDGDGYTLAADLRPTTNGGGAEVPLSRGIYRLKGSTVAVRVYHYSGASKDVLPSLSVDSDDVYTEFNVVRL